MFVRNKTKKMADGRAVQTPRDYIIPTRLCQPPLLSLRLKPYSERATKQARDDAKEKLLRSVPLERKNYCVFLGFVELSRSKQLDLGQFDGGETGYFSIPDDLGQFIQVFPDTLQSNQ